MNENRTPHQATLVISNMSYQYDWDKGLVNRNYHILEQLIQSGTYKKILSVDFLPFTFKKKVKVMLREKPWKKNAETVASGFTWRVDRDKERPELLHFSGLSTQQVERAMTELGIVDNPELTMWFYNPLAIDLIDHYPQAFTVFDAVDNWMEHGSYTAFVDELQNCYEKIRRSTDLIFTVSQSLVDFFGKRKNVIYVPNGVDVAHFANAHCAYPGVKEKKGPIIGYHGNIQNRLNFTVIDYLAQKHPEYQFIFAGFVWKEARAQMRTLQKYENVTVISDVSYNDLPQLIACFDVAIIPHVIDQFTQSMNPLKMYEYIASGKPIISTAVAGAEQLGDLIQLAVSPEDFSHFIHDALQKDNAGDMERRLVAAEQHDWKNRFAVMRQAIELVVNDLKADQNA